MTSDSRDRLVRLVRRPDADPAEAALLCAVEVDPALDVDATLLRLDALADLVRTHGRPPADPKGAARSLTEALGERQGFVGDADTYHDPDNALLHRVLERKRGLPISLSIVYVAVARRLAIPAYAIALPGHVVAAVANGARPVVLDPFAGGVRLDEAAIATLVADATGGTLGFRRAMLRPAPTVALARRLLLNLTRDLAAAGRTAEALRTGELTLLLPNRVASDHRTVAQLALRMGQFDRAAASFEACLRSSGEDAPDRDRVRREAVAARARMN